ncbi:MAG TPA: acyl-CoA dehydrogenase [Spirochaetota bacterium]|nr:acyl-CoA dehydrogenase [Spirochaetota bacterium]
MALNPLVDSRDVRFVLFEMLDIERLCEYEMFSMFDRDMFESTIELAEKIAVEKVYPVNMTADKQGGAQYDPETSMVTSPPEFREAMAVFNEACFAGLAVGPEWGGSGMPEVLYRCILEYFFAASLAFTMHVTLSVGAANLIDYGASEDLKRLYLGNMVSGKWGGTMCLTESDAGSDVGALKTKAVKQPDGTYRITGQKIFISSGDNDIYENMVHPVLARIEGDPPGTKGISIFLVPKFIANPDGTIGRRNDVVCSGIEHKMGIKGSATCTLNFGDNGNCVGYLMGEERKGMKIMFHMMNEARTDVAVEALGVSSSAYMHAVTYAKNRIQGADVTKKDGSGVPIIRHPDVKRMLLWMKANVEAMRMITLYAASLSDIGHGAGGDEAREALELLDFLIPICKAGNTDLGWLITGEAIQVYGGYGYCSDYPVEQLARDSKILAIYEGTNGIQSIDLTMRKLLMNPDMALYRLFKKKVMATIEQAHGVVDTTLIQALIEGLERMDETVSFLVSMKDSGKMEAVFAAATPLQQGFRMLAHGWMHLWSLSAAMPKLKELAGSLEGAELETKVKDNPELAYYYGKVLSGRFYLGTEFKKFNGILDYILSGENAVAESFAEIFTGALEE